MDGGGLCDCEWMEGVSVTVSEWRGQCDCEWMEGVCVTVSGWRGSV